MNTPDSSLLERWTSGRDAQAFTELVSRHAGMVYATCRRILRNAADAEDATQDCFLQLSQGRPPKERPLGTWLHRIATNRSLDLLRKNRRRVRREKTYADTRQTLEEPGWDDIQHYVDQAIEALPADLRAPIVYHFLEGKTQEEAATLIGITRSGSTRRIQRGVERIRKDLARRGIRVSLPALGAMLGTHLAEATPLPAALTAALGKLALAGGAQGVATTGALSTLLSLVGSLGGKGTSVGAGLLVAVLAITYFVASSTEAPETIVSSQQLDTQDALEIAVPKKAPASSDSAGTALPPDTENTTVTNAEEAEPDDAIHGRIVNAVTGEPVELHVRFTGEVTGGNEFSERADKNGEFRLNRHGLGYGTFTISVKNYSYYPFVSQEGVRRRGVPTPEIILRVTELSTISGRVLYADGSPVQGGSIMRRMLGGNSDTLTFTDENGSFREHHDGGRWVLWARKNLLWSDEVVLNLDRETSVSQDFVLPPKGGFTLSLNTADGGEVSDIYTSILMTEGITSPYLFAERVGKNRFVVGNLPYDTYSLELRAKGYAPTLIEYIDVNEFSPNPTVSARLIPATLYSLTIQVVDANGRAVPDAGISLQQLGERLDAQGNAQADMRLEVARDGKNTDANGEWTARNIFAGIYRVYCNDHRGVGEVIVEVPATAYVALPIRKADSIYYRVEFLDPFAGRKPMSSIGTYTFIVREDGTPSGSTSDWGHLQHGWNSIIALKEGRTAFIDAIHVGPSPPSDGILIQAVLGEAGLISGSVEESNGAPAAFDYLYVFPSALWPLAREAWSTDWKNLGNGLAQGARVGADGNFAVDYLPEGSYVVALSDTAYSEPISVKPGYETGPIVLTRDTE